ncbi:hypothetical protein C5167_002716 [Papaver somniferum]|uniref:Strictosidine synthase n=1 Tax=Papaver somniferum TaxID=3469 RepID=A0A0D4CHZ2_PAPSO|nr:protein STRICTOSIDINE SYNTHASE-LIKE 3-like [Papaver somniferum]AJT49020.1 strictosidine synthase [Papaver somniferum]RZC78497.1 hypothetical protein C5167_002716 [Papaver somniferum]
MALLAKIFALLFLLLAVYCAVDPFKHSSIAEFPNFVAHKVEMYPWSELPTERDSKNLLQKSEIKFLNQVQGPESIAFDPLGRGPYTGLADGRIVFWNGESWTDFACTSPNRSELCKPQASALAYLKNEHICGRPLGLRFDKKTGDMYICDAYLGLMKVGPDGGLATSLVTEAEGVPLKFTNDLDIDDEGNIYFTDSSITYQRRNFIQLVFSGDNSGRLLKYNPNTKETTVLVRGLQFPNGVSMSKDKSFFIFCEGSLGRLRRYWLKGEKAGESEVFAILPGFPDNVRTNEKGEFWVAVHCRRSIYSYVCGLYPGLRKFLLKFPITAKIQFLLNIGGRLHGVLVKYSPEGKLLQILEDSEGKVVKAASEVEERDGKLWIGSVLMPFVAVYQLE